MVNFKSFSTVGEDLRATARPADQPSGGRCIRYQLPIHLRRRMRVRSVETSFANVRSSEFDLHRRSFQTCTCKRWQFATCVQEIGDFATTGSCKAKHKRAAPAEIESDDARSAEEPDERSKIRLTPLHVRLTRKYSSSKQQQQPR